MATSESVDSLSITFKRLEDNINVVIKQIKDGERVVENKDSFDRQKYWSTVDAVYKMLSTETTKISLAFSKKPYPSQKNTEAMVIELEKRILTLVSLYYSLPPSEGTTLLSHYKKAVLQVLDCLSGFASALYRCVAAEKHSDRLQWTGGVWEASSFVLPKDNKQCALRSLAGTAELVGDALGEINEARESDGATEDFCLDQEDGEDQDGESDSPAVWSEQDKNVVSACEGLVKTTKAMLKKTRETVEKKADINKREDITMLDGLVNMTSSFSQSVDDFICCIYAPVNYAALKTNGSRLSDLTAQCLQFLRDSDLTDDQDIKWLDFLTQAVTHNMQKLEEKTKPMIDRG